MKTNTLFSTFMVCACTFVNVSFAQLEQTWQDIPWSNGGLTPTGPIWSLDGFHDFDNDDRAEFYMLIIYPQNHDVLFLSTSQGIYVSQDAGERWEPMNDGLPVTMHRIRDNVAQNLKLTADHRALILSIVDYGVWRAEIVLQ